MYPRPASTVPAFVLCFLTLFSSPSFGPCTRKAYKAIILPSETGPLPSGYLCIPQVRALSFAFPLSMFLHQSADELDSPVKHLFPLSDLPLPPLTASPPPQRAAFSPSSARAILRVFLLGPFEQALPLMPFSPTQSLSSSFRNPPLYLSFFPWKGEP